MLGGLVRTSMWLVEKKRRKRESRIEEYIPDEGPVCQATSSNGGAGEFLLNLGDFVDFVSALTLKMKAILSRFLCPQHLMCLLT